MLQSNLLNLGYRIGYVSNVFSGPVYKELEKAFGIRRPKFATLFSLAHLKRATASDICTLTGISKNTISRAVNELLREGRVRSSTDKVDNRRAILALTAEGRALFEKLVPLFVERQSKMVSVLSPDERATFEELLTKLMVRNDGWNKVY